MRALTNHEVTFGDEELIVSKTDLAGRITYANDVFVRVCGYSATELIGQPHNLIRHPAMPRAVFRFLWDELHAGREVFAYVMNLTCRGDFYWVFAHITPTLDLGKDGAVIGYHSNRRSPNRAALPLVSALYADVLAEEAKVPNPKEAALAGLALVVAALQKRGGTWNQWMFDLEAQR